MAEPTSTTLVAGATVVGLAFIPGIDSNALIGSFAGATLFVMSARELTLITRVCYLIISLVMGYMAAPELLANTFIQESGVAGFIAGLLSVSVALVLIERVRERFDLADLLKRLRP